MAEQTIPIPGFGTLVVPEVPGLPSLPLPVPTGTGGVTLPGKGAVLTEEELKARDAAAYQKGRESMYGLLIAAALVGGVVGHAMKR